MLTHLNSVIANLVVPQLEIKSREVRQGEYKTESLVPARQSVCDKRPDQNSSDEDLSPPFNPHYPPRSQLQSPAEYSGTHGGGGDTGHPLVSGAHAAGQQTSAHVSGDIG